jgi:hypothetical protein
MALTPMDIITKHFNQILASKWLPDGAPDAAELAIELNEELKRNFRIVALAEPWEESARTPVMVPLPPQGAEDITIQATANPTLWYFGTNRQPIRLDELVPGNLFPLRERQIALALIDLSANTLRDQTL